MLTQAVVVTLFVDASLPGWLYSCCGELMEIETHEGATADTKNIPTTNKHVVVEKVQQRRML